jgi:hypothetical protein
MSGPAAAREAVDSEQARLSCGQVLEVPRWKQHSHSINKLGLSNTNFGIFGLAPSASICETDCYTGGVTTGGEYPIGSEVMYCYAASVWVGAIVDDDTLVSTGFDGWMKNYEMHPDAPPFEGFRVRSNLDTSLYFSLYAVSELDVVGVCADTFDGSQVGYVQWDYSERPHFPLNLQITLSTYSWSAPVAEDIVLLKCDLRNIGSTTLEEMYFGIYVDPDVKDAAHSGGTMDDMSNFMPLAVDPFLPKECAEESQINLAWSSDDGGVSGIIPRLSHATGIVPLSIPLQDPIVSFNWWFSHGLVGADFGPHRVESFRDFGTGGHGTPEGDANK